MDKKISIITITDMNNYGNRLQNYALQKQLQKMEFQVETILNKTYKLSLHSQLKTIIKDKCQKLLNKKIRQRENNFISFSTNYINSTSKYLYTNEKIMLNNDTDIYVIGSDQIWNYSFRGNNFGDFEFCLFESEKKIISYAASFGITRIPHELEDIYIKGLNNLNFISVREKAAVDIVYELTNKKANLVLDPTLLLSTVEWDEVSKKPNGLIESKFILTYFLGNLSYDKKAQITQFAIENDYIIIDLLDEKSDYYSCGPSEFLYLEKHASLVCTDSFHSCVFALLYNTPFIVFERDDNNLSMNSRVDSLLKLFELENRRFKINLNSDMLTCDFSRANELLAIEKNKSIKYLKSSLK